jgi:hypothetical protein
MCIRIVCTRCQGVRQDHNLAVVDQLREIQGVVTNHHLPLLFGAPEQGGGIGDQHRIVGPFRERMLDHCYALSLTVYIQSVVLDSQYILYQLIPSVADRLGDLGHVKPCMDLRIYRLEQMLL